MQNKTKKTLFLNNDYEYEIIKETEKAILIQIYCTKKTINWTKWIPKSAIIQ